MNYYAGIDPGVNSPCMVTVSYNKNITIENIINPVSTSRITLGDRLKNIHHLFGEEMRRCTLLVCEGPSFRSTNLSYSLGAAHGVILLAAAQSEVPLYKVAPLGVKKFICGKTRINNSKELVKEHILRTFNFVLPKEISENDDAIDALALACIAVSLGEGIVHPDRSKMEVLAGISLYNNFN